MNFKLKDKRSLALRAKRSLPLRDKQSLLLRNKFLLLGIAYASLILVGLFILAFRWLPSGYTLAGHDSGLPLDAKQFLLTRLWAWDDRLDFGLDNSANFGSLTIHFFDWLSSVIAQVLYAGSFISPFFWLGLIFISALFFAYQLKGIFGKPFVFILPFLLTFNFYIFQSMFMLERAKFGIFSATLISLAVVFRMHDKKLGVLSAALLSSLALSIFNGGGLFGVTLYGGVVLILGLLLLSFLARGLIKGDFTEFRRTVFFLTLTLVFYLALNAYSLLPFINQFFMDNPTALFQESLLKANQEWLRYVSRSTAFLNLFRFYAVPDWYGTWGEVYKANPSHPYAFLYLNNPALVFISFLFPTLAFCGLFLAKRGEQRRTLAFFGMIALIGIFFAAGSHRPLGLIYEWLMEVIPGFVLFRSAFYKFGVFYMFGMLVMLASTISFSLEKFASILSPKVAKISLVVGTIAFLGFWSGYHWVLSDGTKIFAWKTDQSTRVKVPGYVYDFSRWAQESNLGEKRILLLPPVNKDWEADAYNWGYWSLSPLLYTLSSVNSLANWHGLTIEETNLVNRLYSTVRGRDEAGFLALAKMLNVGYLLVRHDVLTRSSWTSTEQPESYRQALVSFRSVESVENFKEWDLYKIVPSANTGIYATTAINISPDPYISLANDFFKEGHSVGAWAVRLYPELGNISSRKMEVYDCLSCRLERKGKLESFPDVSILPDSMFYLFKERQEQKLLSQPKGPKSKMGDYLGLILRRTAEQQKMIDMSAKEKYLSGNARVIRTYLDKIYSQLESSPETFRDFETASLFLDYLGPVEHALSDYVKSSKFKGSSRDFVDEMLGVVWVINKINEFFGALLESPEKWSNQKVYKVVLPDDGEYELFFPTSSYPKYINGETIIPKIVELRQNNKAKILEVVKEQEGWLKAHLDNQMGGETELVLHFEELPNLLAIEGSGLEKFSYGKTACLEGSIANFDRGRAYEVKVSRTDRLRPVKIIFSDKSFAYSEKHGFLQGEDSFEVPATAEGSFARYIFFPSVSADIISLYICSDNAELPKIDKIEVKEFFSPPVIGATGSHASTRSFLDVSYLRLSPTRYQAQVNNIKTPYILVLNQKFNPSWRLSIENGDGGLTLIDKHFMVDGYANGWLVDQVGTSKFRIEYTPQRLFYVGGAISAASLLAGTSWLIVSFFRRKRDGF